MATVLAAFSVLKDHVKLKVNQESVFIDNLGNESQIWPHPLRPSSPLARIFSLFVIIFEVTATEKNVIINTFQSNDTLFLRNIPTL